MDEVSTEVLRRLAGRPGIIEVGEVRHFRVEHHGDVDDVELLDRGPDAGHRRFSISTLFSDCTGPSVAHVVAHLGIAIDRRAPGGGDDDA